MIRGLDYFYDAQQRRFLEQVVRAFSGFQYMTGARAGQPGSLQMVPCRWAHTSRVVAAIMRNQSENTLLAVPMITVFQTGLTFRPEGLQNRSHVDSRQVVERAVDDDGNYLPGRGKSYTIHRLMPLPFSMEIQVDLWTSNLEQKYQLAEQILMSVCPNFDIQNSENPLDWTALTTASVEDITWTSRSIPVGTNDEIDIMTLRLKLPMWISPPAQVQQQSLIEQIVTNISDTDPLPGVVLDGTPIGERFSQSITTPGNHRVRVEGSTITLLSSTGDEDDQNWHELINLYGNLRPAASQMLLRTTDDIEGPSIVGTLQYTSDNTKLHWQIDPDTLPANTLAPVNAVIDPMTTFPGKQLPDGTTFPAAAPGQRYLIIHDVGPCVAWGNLNARYGDIIEYQNGEWVVAFTSTGSPQQYVRNLHTGGQLRWTGDDWVLAIDGEYAPGYWRLAL